MKKVKDLMACCGLDCEKCDARIATVRNDNDLLKVLTRVVTAKNWIVVRL